MLMQEQEAGPRRPIHELHHGVEFLELFSSGVPVSTKA